MSPLENPARSQMYVRLITDHELKKDTVRKFYNVVKEHAPQNVITAFNVLDPNGSPTKAYIVHYVTEDGSHVYEVPLVRNLLSDEIYEIAVNLEKTFNEGDFVFETSTEEDECCPDDEDVFVDDHYEDISERLAQRMHNKWMHKRIDQGWRYGEERNDSEKTHPLLKPWDQLSDEEKTIDYDLLNDIVDLLSEFNYTIISMDELDELMNKTKDA